MPASRLSRLGSWCFRRRRRVLASWIAALAFTFVVLAPLAGEFRADFNTPGSDSEAADRVLQERFPDRSSATIDVVWRAEAGVRDAAVGERIDSLLAAAQRLEGIGGASPPEYAPDGNTAIVRLQIDAENDGDVPKETGERLIALAERATGDELQVAMAGWAISEAQESDVSPEAVGFAIAALVLLMTFGSLLAAGLPLVTALFGLGIGTTLVGTVAALTDVPDFAPAVAGMMAIGVGIDYALIVITRYRVALAAGRQPQDAAAEAITTAGRAVLVAGLIVVIALLGLFAMRLPFLNGVAISSSIAVAVAALAAVTLLPALLGFVGPRIDRLRVPFTGGRVRFGRPSRWFGYSRAVADGLATTARVITAAAAIMIAVFSSFALADDIILKLMGIGLATAILVDATIVRMVLVPSIMQLLGRANWWLPGWMGRLLPGGAARAAASLLAPRRG